MAVAHSCISSGATRFLGQFIGTLGADLLAPIEDQHVIVGSHEKRAVVAEMGSVDHTP